LRADNLLATMPSMIDLLTREQWFMFSGAFLALAVHMRWGSVDFAKRGGRRWRGWWYR